jgi:hypothetical protein
MAAAMTIIITLRISFSLKVNNRPSRVNEMKNRKYILKRIKKRIF